MQHESVLSYNNPERAEQYNTKKGFDPARKERMLDATLHLLTTLAPPQSSLLELGAGTGLFTRQIVQTNHFHEIYVTDGASAMLDIARRELSQDGTHLYFELLDFSQPWTTRYENKQFHAVTSSMAIHHVEQKQNLFRDVFSILVPGGVLVFADHIAGSTAEVDQMIGFERARIRLTSLGKGLDDEKAVADFLERDSFQQQAEGNRCESLSHYLTYLKASGFADVDCLWRDFWLAVFVARKPLH